MKRSPRPIALLVTCEHGGNRIPARYARWFAGHAWLLATHRAYDAGALDTARTLARACHAPLVACTISRLLVDLNRSPGHPHWFGDALRNVPEAVRTDIVERVYRPHRERVAATLERLLARGVRVVHVASHSFTPVLRGRRRRADVGLLFDPSRSGERELAASWQRRLQRALPGLVVRRNYPYRGVSDGLASALRRGFADLDYAGIELEVNQRWLRRDPDRARVLRRAMATTLQAALHDLEAGGQRARRASTRPGESSA